MNKYYSMLDKILTQGKEQANKKGKIIYLLNQQLHLTPADLPDIFEGYRSLLYLQKNVLFVFLIIGVNSFIGTIHKC